jgi:hypothetical protein
MLTTCILCKWPPRKHDWNYSQRYNIRQLDRFIRHTSNTTHNSTIYIRPRYPTSIPINTRTNTSTAKTHQTMHIKFSLTTATRRTIPIRRYRLYRRNKQTAQKTQQTQHQQHLNNSLSDSFTKRFNEKTLMLHDSDNTSNSELDEMTDTDSARSSINDEDGGRTRRNVESFHVNTWTGDMEAVNQWHLDAERSQGRIEETNSITTREQEEAIQ